MFLLVFIATINLFKDQFSKEGSDLHETPNKTTRIFLSASLVLTVHDRICTHFASLESLEDFAGGEPLPFGSNNPNDGLAKVSHPGGGPCVGSIVVVTALFD